MRCWGCGKIGHKMNNCPKVAWNKKKIVLETGPRNPPTSAPEGRPPLRVQHKLTRTLTSLKLEEEYTI